MWPLLRIFTFLFESKPGFCLLTMSSRISISPMPFLSWAPGGYSESFLSYCSCSKEFSSWLTVAPSSTTSVLILGNFNVHVDVFWSSFVLASLAFMTTCHISHGPTLAWMLSLPISILSFSRVPFADHPSYLSRINSLNCPRPDVGSSSPSLFSLLHRLTLFYRVVIHHKKHSFACNLSLI